MQLKEQWQQMAPYVAQTNIYTNSRINCFSTQTYVCIRKPEIKSVQILYVTKPLHLQISNTNNMKGNILFWLKENRKLENFL